MTRLTPAAVSALLLSAFAGSADAQFVAEEKSAPVTVSSDAGGSGMRTGVQTIVTTANDGTVYKLVARDSSIDGVWINGEPVPADRVERDERVVRLLGKDGKVVHEFRLGGPQIPAPPAPPAPSTFRLGVTADPSQPGVFSIRGAAPAEPPPVMLGINLSEPGDALRAQLGLGETPVILVDGVIDGLPAGEAGVKRFDVIVSIDGSDGASGETLTKVLRAKKPGDTLKLIVIRAGEKKPIEAKLVAYDAQPLGRDRVEIIQDGQAPFPQIWIEHDEHGDVFRHSAPGAESRARLESRSADEAARAQELAMRAAEQAQRYSDEIQRKVERAMRDAERRVLELRGDQLFVRSAQEAEDMARHLEREAQSRLPELRGELDARLEAMERRFEALERDLESRLERLTSIMERLADRLEKAGEERED